MKNFNFLIFQTSKYPWTLIGGSYFRNQKYPLFCLVSFNGNKIKETTIEEVIICYKIIIEIDLVSRQPKQKCEKDIC